MYNMFEEYKNEQEIIDDFIRGEIEPKNLVFYYDKNERFREWIENKNKEARYINSFWNKISKKDSSAFINEVRNEIQIYFESDLYNYIFRLFSSFDNKLIACDKWTKRTSLLTETVPESLDGNTDILQYIIENIISKLPTDLSNAKRVKLCKEEIKKAFYIEGNKYPHWIQSSEWPLSKNGKPTKYLRTENKHGGEVKAYIFLDVDTNEEIVVEQCY